MYCKKNFDNPFLKNDTQSDWKKIIYETYILTKSHRNSKNYFQKS
ncbi:hypothetical protein LEP1GSC132_0988 [Leptospira kirschneri str. 200803703]|nr:hypothetical protein LEP1GSC018_1964 [Leptospira kirschneri str. 2008720114]EMJ91427.1 hypothetical protein LEP1GSC198_2227 [Leptospira kirschneri str. JB]EMK10832.1 hypothetical protein LEP1GSC166_3459 [Leptospira kirschneri]EMK15178.1 hypothetical protein LEP1GSC042_3630 [Leptospira kirschneri serovar Bim str. PUO 1247]EMN06662.1 hypothetical protein LEP1GSC046_2307 [Leptospira kirschneri serovar Bim str. 1051]EMN25241.1 hypothetical protein LEP1GSC065_1936 [Leptospira kirschneri serovar 